MNKKELWLNLAQYNFDHLAPVHLWDVIAAKFGGQNPFTKAFADKLSRKLNWKKEFAMKAIWEYKKFVFLGVISDFSVTPSKVIDQVWHEHLLFSRGYRKFCDEVIQYDFAHNPELITVGQQTEAFQMQYLNTIDLYEKEFGCKPPDDIWSITKFNVNKKQLKKHAMENLSIASSSNIYDGTDTLTSMFSSAEVSTFEYGSGEFGGGGASGDWDDGSGNSSDGDSGSSTDGGTSCSSSCGGCGGD